MQIQVTADLMRKVARLSRLALSPEEEKELREHFEKILGFVASFQHLDTSRVDPTHFSPGTFNVVREDVVRESLPNEEALRNAPSSRPPYFLVPRIVGGDDEGGSLA